MAYLGLASVRHGSSISITRQTPCQTIPSQVDMLLRQTTMSTVAVYSDRVICPLLKLLLILCGGQMSIYIADAFFSLVDFLLILLI